MLERVLIELADANLAESHSEFSRWHPDYAVLEEEGLLLTRGADRFPGVNFAMRVGDSGQPIPELLITRAREFFAGRANGFAIRTRMHCDHDLIARCRSLEFPCVGESPGLVLESTLPEERLPAGVSLRTVTDEAGARTFGDVCVRAYQTIGLPMETGRRMFTLAERLLAPHMHAVIAYLDGAPSAAAMVLMSHRLGGVYWVGTVPEARGRQLARHVTRAAGNWAFDHGAAAVVLQASNQGEPVYRAMGYREFTRYPWFLSPIA